MTSISIDNEIVQDLISTKLKVLDESIQEILTRWNMASIEHLMETVTEGQFKGATSDIIEIQKLVKKQEEIKALSTIEEMHGEAQVKIAKMKTNLESEIQDARMHILSLTDNWDNLGSIGYQEELFNRVEQFLKQFSAKIWKISLNTKTISSPFIQPGDAGSIDLHWKNKDFELLINIPPKITDSIGLYGDNNGANKIELAVTGIQNIEEILIPWLKLIL